MHGRFHPRRAMEVRHDGREALFARAAGGKQGNRNGGSMPRFEGVCEKIAIGAFKARGQPHKHVFADPGAHERGILGKRHARKHLPGGIMQAAELNFGKIGGGLKKRGRIGSRCVTPEHARKARR